MTIKNRILKALLMIAAAGLLVFLSASPLLKPWRARLLEAGLPAFSRLRSVSSGLSERLGRGSRIRALEDERVRLLAEISRLKEAGRENEVLRRALGLRDEGEAGAIIAGVAGFLREGRDEFLLLNRGAGDGIGVGDTVIDRNRVLAGTVIDVGRRSSRVILLSSPSRSVEVRIAGTELRAIARGNNSRELVVELVPQGAEIKAGDLLVASLRSSGGHGGLSVGEIREVRQAGNEIFKTVKAVHLFDPAEEEVIVLLAP